MQKNMKYVSIGHSPESWIAAWLRLTTELHSVRPDVEFDPDELLESWESSLQSLNDAPIPLPNDLKMVLWSAESSDIPGTIRRYLADGIGHAIGLDEYGYSHVPAGSNELSPRLECALNAWRTMTPDATIRDLVTSWSVNRSPVDDPPKDIYPTIVTFMAAMREHHEAHSQSISPDDDCHEWNLGATDLMESSGLPFDFAHALFWNSTVTDELEDIRELTRVLLMYDDLGWSEALPGGLDDFKTDLAVSIEMWVHRYPSQARDLLRRWPTSAE